MDVIAFGPQRQIGCSPEGISIRINFEARFKNLQKLVETIYARVADLVLGHPAGTRAIQDYLGHKAIQHTVRYTELTPTKFKDFWRYNPATAEVWGFENEDGENIIPLVTSLYSTHKAAWRRL
jgi:hypothetical protein